MLCLSEDVVTSSRWVWICTLQNTSHLLSNLVFYRFPVKYFLMLLISSLTPSFYLEQSENVVNMIDCCLPLQFALSVIPHILKWDTCVGDRLYMWPPLHNFQLKLMAFTIPLFFALPHPSFLYCFYT